MKALFLVNERSGKKRAFAIEDLIRKSTAFDAQIVSCARKEDLDGIIDRAEHEEVEVVFAVGGDGTVHETAKRLIGRRPALGILPIGSGNGFARHIGLPLDPTLTLDACREGRIVTIDTAEVNGAAFVGVMGIGLDALIAERFASSSVRGLETYVREGLRAFTDFRAEEYELAWEAETLRRKAYVIAVANASQYGNNARIAPLASLQDGLLDVVVVHDVSVIAAPLLLARLFQGSLDRSNGVTMMQCPSVTIRRAASGAAHLDGEPVELSAELNVQIVPQSLRLLVPDAAAVI